jgi:nucleoside-diphosphate-sugar epimerase
MILIIGANGITGRAIIRNLVARGASVRGLDIPAAQDQIRELGAEPIVGDMRNVDSRKLEKLVGRMVRFLALFLRSIIIDFFNVLRSSVLRKIKNNQTD